MHPVGRMTIRYNAYHALLALTGALGATGSDPGATVTVGIPILVGVLIGIAGAVIVL